MTTSVLPHRWRRIFPTKKKKHGPLELGDVALQRGRPPPARVRAQVEEDGSGALSEAHAAIAVATHVLCGLEQRERHDARGLQRCEVLGEVRERARQLRARLRGLDARARPISHGYYTR
jgi:hypothetical protein